MAYGPHGTHVDIVIHGTDNRPYRASADSPTELRDAVWTPMGGPSSVVLKIIQQGWLADGSDFVVIAKGSDDKAYVWTDSSSVWTAMAMGTVGTNE